MLDRTIRPAISDYPTLALPQVGHIKLNNGITIHYLHSDAQPILRLTVQYNGGFSEVSDPYAQILMPPMMREGAAGLSGEDISAKLDNNGAWLKISSEQHFTSLVLHALSENALDSVDLVKDILLNPTFPEKEYNALKRTLSGAMRVNKSKVTSLAGKNLLQLIMGQNHPYANRPDDGDTLDGLGHDTLINCYNQLISNKLPTIYLAGDVNGLLPQIQQIFNSDDWGHPATTPLNVKYFNTQTTRTTVTHLDNALQSAVYIGYPTIGRDHPDYIDLRLAIIALGGYFGSRLNANIREDKGLTYGINASLNGTLDGAYMKISSQTDPTYTEALISETLGEIERLKTIPLTQQELSAVKNHAMTSLASTLDSPLNIMDTFINQVTLGTPADYFQKQQTAIRHLTPERIQEVASKYLPEENLRISIVKP